MSVALNRKRSASTPEPPDSSRYSPSLGESLKRTKTDSELDALGVIPSSEAWCIDLSAILCSPTVPKAPQGHHNPASSTSAKSIFLFCVQGDYELHYNLLCSHLPSLRTICPSLQAFVLCRDPATHTPSKTTPSSLPMIQAVSGSHNHFVRLGLLHPLGGGHYPLDALVVLDPQGRRRLVLPFGWGAGRHAGNVGGGKIVQDRLMTILRNCIEQLRLEQ